MRSSLGSNDERFVRMTAACAIVGIVIYVALALLDPVLVTIAGSTPADFLTALGSTGAGRMSMGAHLLLAGAAMLWLLGFLGLYRLIDSSGQSWSARIGVIFGILACVIVVEMLVIQGSVMVGMGRRFVAAPAEAQEIALVVYSGLRIVDQALDLSFDAFFFTAWILFAMLMFKHPSFGQVVGASGLVLFGTAAVLNLYAAPRPPAFDVGPLAGVWVLTVYVLMFRATRRRRPEPPAGRV